MLVSVQTNWMAKIAGENIFSGQPKVSATLWAIGLVV